MTRPLRIKVSRRRGLRCPEALAEALAEYLLGRSDTVPTVNVNRKEVRRG